MKPELEQIIRNSERRLGFLDGLEAARKVFREEKDIFDRYVWRKVFVDYQKKYPLRGEPEQT